MTDINFSDYFESKYSSDAERKRYAQNSLIVDTSIALAKALESTKMAQKDLAARLGRSEGYISQVLSGGANLTLRTLANFAYAMDRMVDVGLKPLDASSVVFTRTSLASWKVELDTAGQSAEANAEAADTQLALAA